MSKSERVTAAQRLAVVRLVNECRELGDDAAAWQRHLHGGLRRLGRARIAMIGPVPIDVRRAPALVHVQGGGDWPSAAARERWDEWTRDLSTEPNFEQNPGLAAFFRLPDPFVTKCRRDLVPDWEWERSEYVHERLRPDWIDEAVISLAPVPAVGQGFSICIHRPIADRPFGRADARLVEVAHRELAPYLGRELLLTTQPNLHGLTPRQRQVLDGLLGGDSEKQVAARLGLHPATVHDHVKRLYRHFGVNTRAELLAYFLRRYRGRRPSPPGGEN